MGEQKTIRNTKKADARRGMDPKMAHPKPIRQKRRVESISSMQAT